MKSPAKFMKDILLLVILPMVFAIVIIGGSLAVLHPESLSMIAEAAMHQPSDIQPTQITTNP